MTEKELAEEFKTDILNQQINEKINIVGIGYNKEDEIFKNIDIKKLKVECKKLNLKFITTKKSYNITDINFNKIYN